MKEIFEGEFSDTSIVGEILIICNATLFGQETKDIDLIAIGKFEKYSQKIKAKSMERRTEKEQKLRNIFINDFCFVIETKSHRVTDIQLDGLTLKVFYNTKAKDVTVQSENQKYSLKKFFEDRLGFSPYICNFIWLRNVSWDSIKALLDNNKNIFEKHNFLPNTFSLRFLFQLACVQNIPWTPIERETGEPKGYSVFNCLHSKQEFDLTRVDKIFGIFQTAKNGTGELTRKKIEKITKTLLKNQRYADAIGKRLVIFSGRAGTGKTIKLLSAACDLAVEQGARCLILTYNHALVSDIKRTLALAEIPDGIDSYTVNILTLHKFFYELIVGFELDESEVKESRDNKKYILNFIDNYINHLSLLEEYLDLNLIGEKEISELMKTRHQQVGWDYLLIDEAQDWKEIEKKLIYKIFGRERVVVADGVDQLIRSQNKCNWRKGLRRDVDFRQTNEKRCLRQKVNLVSFVNNFSDKLDIIWNLEPKKELIGGKVIISTKPYSQVLHKKLFNQCLDEGNSAYEMLFLVPPSLVDRQDDVDEYGNTKKVRKFKKTEEFNQMEINIWDGTRTDLRTRYAINLNEHRLLQYESCRGLEGWIVVNLDFDSFIEYKMKTFIEEENSYELALESFEEKKRKFVYLWALIPLTRAIDTLVITLRDSDSFIAKVLHDVYEENPDYIEWIG